MNYNYDSQSYVYSSFTSSTALVSAYQAHIQYIIPCLQTFQDFLTYKHSYINYQLMIEFKLT